MAVLVCLAVHAPEPVSKEILLQEVWPDTFVSEGVLVRSICELRRVFEDKAKNPCVIQTIAKRGYRLLAPVVAVKSGPGGDKAGEQEQFAANPRFGRPTATKCLWQSVAGIFRRHDNR